MSWILTSQGHEHHMHGHQAMGNAFELADVAHALALQNRFNGHTKRPYSVAECYGTIGALVQERDRLLHGEFICQRCGLRKDSERSTEHEF